MRQFHGSNAASCIGYGKLDILISVDRDNGDVPAVGREFEGISYEIRQDLQQSKCIAFDDAVFPENSSGKVNAFLRCGIPKSFQRFFDQTIHGLLFGGDG